jgi:Sulfotransferase family
MGSATLIERQTLIVCGVARSGTTALARVLNAHPLVCVGLERYKFHCYHGGGFGPNLFDKDRFFDFQEGDTNLLPEADKTYATLYAAMRQKWDLAQVVGDKIPHAFLCMDSIEAAYPKVRFLYIVRDIEAVASSWNARALNVLDRGWPRGEDCRRAVKTWNAGNKCVLNKMARCPDRIQVIDYDRFFSGELAELDRVRSFLDLQTDSNLRQEFVGSAQEHTNIMANRKILIDTQEQEFVRQNANMENYWSLIAHSVDGAIW